MMSLANTLQSQLNKIINSGQIIFFGETHRSLDAIFSSRIPVLDILKNSNVDCLMLEQGKHQYQEAFDQFNSGASYEKSILLADIQVWSRLNLRSPPLSESQRDFFSRVQKLKLKIFAIDEDLSQASFKNFFRLNRADQHAKYLESEMGRNLILASNIVAPLNQGVCRRTAVFIGSTHINTQSLADYSSRTLSSIPKILGLAGWKQTSIKLNTPPEPGDDEIYSAILQL